MNRPLLLPTLLTLLLTSALLALGCWQLQRQHWKEDLLAYIRTQKELSELDLDREAPTQELNYRHVRLSGTFLHEHEFTLLSRTRNGQVGAQILTPLRQANGTLWLVNRGWVPVEQTNPATRAQGQVSGLQHLTGTALRPLPPGWMQPANTPARNQWFWIDLAAMATGAQLGVPLQPWIIELDASVPGGPLGGSTRPDLPNNHFQYALTWFALAAILCGIYLLWLRRQRHHFPC